MNPVQGGAFKPHTDLFFVFHLCLWVAVRNLPEMTDQASSVLG